MGKLANLIMFMIALQAILILFEGSDPENTAIWQIAVNPSSWSTQTVIVEILLIAGVLGALGLVGIAVGNIIGGIKTDFMVFAVLIASLFGFLAVLVDFSGVIGKYACNFFCEANIGVAATTWYTCPPAVWIVTITVGSLLVYSIFVIMDWWRGRD